jgi:phosphoadenosine phosphosulfate reductase
MGERRLGEEANGDFVTSQLSVREGNVALAVDPESLQQQLERSSLDQRLETIATAFQNSRLAVVSSSGPGSLIVIHTLHELGIRLPVVFVDTLHHFPETLEHLERVRAKYDLDLRIFRACETREEFEARYGPRLWERDLDLYQEVSKVEPFRRASAELDAWITGRRREQGQKRTELPMLEPGDQVRINPLADWNRTQVWRFILDREIPYNPLHDQGFASIGDAPLTTAIGDGEAERDGRWRGTPRTECGIHE